MSQQEVRTGKTETPVEAAEAAELDPRARKELEKLVAKINALVAEAESRFDAIANLVFGYCFETDHASALDPNTAPTRQLMAMMGAAGGELHLDAASLRRYLRIGALNQKLGSGKWGTLSPSVKMELLPLLGTDLNFDRLQAGIRYASQGEVTMRQVRTWVANRLDSSPSGQPNAPARPPSFVAGNNAVDVGVRFGRMADRRRWLDRVSRLSKEERSQQLVRVRSAARNFEKLAQELEAMVAEE